MQSKVFNVYCDESCHLEHDHIPVMTLGAVWCPREIKDSVFRDIRALKERYGLSKQFEAKWVKVSPAKEEFYLSLVEYFFKNRGLHFRGVVIPDKMKLDHERFSQTHDGFYYKMWFVLLKQIFAPDCRYRVFIDIKDTHGQSKVAKLHEVLCNAQYDFDRKMIEDVQQIHSHEVEIMQLTDILVGALAYIHRGLTSSTAKQKLIKRMRDLSGLDLLRSTLPREKKINLLVWNAQEW
jgi:hypothetical protein